MTERDEHPDFMSWNDGWNSAAEAAALSTAPAPERRELEQLRIFREFVRKWVERGPPHGGPGNEATVVSAIRYHPALRTTTAPAEGETP